VRLLERLGYVVDSSVTPCVSWRRHAGLPGGPGGPDFTAAPLSPYHPCQDDPAARGTSRLLEVPVSVVWPRRMPLTLAAQRVPVFNAMIHSSELFPGTSPYFPDQRAVDALFDRMDRALDAIFRLWSPVPMTLTEAAHARFACHGSG
jgi:hypothetical protein